MYIFKLIYSYIYIFLFTSQEFNLNVKFMIKVLCVMFELLLDRYICRNKLKAKSHFLTFHDNIYV